MLWTYHPLHLLRLVLCVFLLLPGMPASQHLCCPLHIFVNSLKSFLFVTLWTVAHQAPPSLGFSRQEHWSGLPCPPLGDLPNPGIEHRSPALQTNSLLSEPPRKPQARKIRINHWLKISLNFFLFWVTSLKFPQKFYFSLLNTAKAFYTRIVWKGEYIFSLKGK